MQKKWLTNPVHVCKLMNWNVKSKFAVLSKLVILNTIDFCAYICGVSFDWRAALGSTYQGKMDVRFWLFKGNLQARVRLREWSKQHSYNIMLPSSVSSIWFQFQSGVGIYQHKLVQGSCQKRKVTIFLKKGKRYFMLLAESIKFQLQFTTSIRSIYFLILLKM